MKKQLVRYCFIQPRSSFFYPTIDDKGFSLIEVLLAVVIMLVALVPVMDSITTSIQFSNAGEENTAYAYFVRQKMDDVLAMDYVDVDVSDPTGTPTALSDTVSYNGKIMDRSVLVEYYDGDGDSLPDSDLKKITVTVESVRHETLMDLF